MKNYDHKKIESKIQKEWDKKKIYQAIDKSKKKKFYSLIEFPYPSGEGLHVGHPRPYIGMDIVSRKRRMEGHNVLFPIGWDAFGLPTENYAIKTGIHPKIITKKNTDNFRRQIKSLGISFDWSREINTTDPAYYKWTQWIFLQFFKKGLAYKAEIPINWCPKDKIGLANEEVIDGKCERCGTQTECRMKNQWMLAITKYADRLDKDLDLVDYPERVKLSQRNWIGRSEGSEIGFRIKCAAEFSWQGLSQADEPRVSAGRACPDSDRAKEDSAELDNTIKVFTTRADTLFGTTYVVLAPEHTLINRLLEKVENKNEVIKYIETAKKRSELERTAENKEKTGVELKGIKAINPANNEEVQIWIADYVLANYGTGAVMAVPAHDERDFVFAKKYDLPIKQVIAPLCIDRKNPPQADKKNVSRKTVHALVINPKNGKILCMKWKNYPWTGFVVGGVDEGEDIISAARREVLEEAGYKNLKLIKVLNNIVCGKYFAAHKNENRTAYSNAVIFEIENGEQDIVNEEEKAKHEPIWLDPKTLNQDNFTCAELDFWFTGINNKEGNDDYTKDGILINSGKFDDIDSEEARKKITEFVGGKMVTKFKLRDWIFSRQRYWGEPIPVVSCEKCGLVPIPEKELPLKLPEVKRYKLTETGESPLAAIAKWVNTKCPKCGDKAKRETDTMPNWAGSSWYYLRFTDPKNKKVFADKKKLKYWTPVDWYNGGMEHTTLHLLYSRFWHKVLYDLKLVPTKEPYKKRTSHGMILGAGGVKMSKSLGNVVNPDDIVKTYGADTLRVYEMFMGPFEDSAVWNTESIIGSRRFIEKVWRIGQKIICKTESSFAGSLSGRARPALTLGSSACERPRQENSVLFTKLLHKTIKKVGEDIEDMHFNTAISAMMILAAEMEKADMVEKEDFKKFLQILAPFAPHVAEDIWQQLAIVKDSPSRAREGLSFTKSIHLSAWPKYDPNLIKDNEIKIAVQVNGKVRAEIMIQTDEKEEDIKKKALENDTVFRFMAGAESKKIIYVKNRLVNIVL